MRRRFLKGAAGFAAVAVVAPRSVLAQPAKRVPRVAYVWIFKDGPSAPKVPAFRERMAELGWVDGKTVEIIIGDAEGRPEKLDAIMRELVESNVRRDRRRVHAGSQVRAQVHEDDSDRHRGDGRRGQGRPRRALRASRRQRHRVSAMLLDQSAKRVAILKEAFPSVTRATVLWNPDRPDNMPEVEVMQAAATSGGMRLDSQQVRTAVELADTLDMLSTSSTQALLDAGDTMMGNQAPRLVAFAARMKIPAMRESREFVDVGGLMSYGPNFPALHRRAADYVDEILRGAKAADLPIEPPSKFELVVNMKTAKALGFTIPQSVLLRADDVIA